MNDQQLKDALAQIDTSIAVLQSEAVRLAAVHNSLRNTSNDVGANADTNTNALSGIVVPTEGSRWLHYNGNVYTVLFCVNNLDTEDYPCSVVYEGPGGRRWTRRLADWHHSFKQLPPEVPATDALAADDRDDKTNKTLEAAVKEAEKQRARAEALKVFIAEQDKFIDELQAKLVDNTSGYKKRVFDAMSYGKRDAECMARGVTTPKTVTYAHASPEWFAYRVGFFAEAHRHSHRLAKAASELANNEHI